MLRISKADRIPAQGIRFVAVKYKFWGSNETFTTEVRRVAVAPAAAVSH